MFFIFLLASLIWQFTTPVYKYCRLNSSLQYQIFCCELNIPNFLKVHQSNIPTPNSIHQHFHSSYTIPISSCQLFHHDLTHHHPLQYFFHHSQLTIIIFNFSLLISPSSFLLCPLLISTILSTFFFYSLH